MTAFVNMTIKKSYDMKNKSFNKCFLYCYARAVIRCYTAYIEKQFKQDKKLLLLKAWCDDYYLKTNSLLPKKLFPIYFPFFVKQDKLDSQGRNNRQ